MRNSKSSKIVLTLCGMLLISGILILMAILFALREIEIPIFPQLGQWFVSRFLLASFYIPAYLIFCAVYLLMPRFNLKVMLTLMTTLIPFLTLVSLLCVLLWTSGIRYLIAVLLVIALVAEVYGIAVFAGLKWRPSFKFNLKSDDDTDEDDIAEKVAEESEEALGDVSDADSDVPAYLSMGFKRISETRERGHFADDDKELVPPDDNVDVKIAEPEDAEPEEPEEVEEKLTPVQARRKKIAKYDIPIDEVLDDHGDSTSFVVTEETKEDAEILLGTLREFKIEAKIIGIKKGPVITMFEILPASGVNVSKIAGLADNIALNLAAQSVRIVAPIPGKRAVGVEIPNLKRSIVGFKDLIKIKNPDFDKAAVPFILGRDIEGESQVIDLAKTPHLLIAGATGSGKSVCVNSLISTVLYKKRPDEVKMILVDPKVVELKIYNDVPHLLTPVITDSKKALQALQYCICEMERRYSLLETLDVRNIEGFNKKIKTNGIAQMPLPYILVVIDEFADLMLTSSKQLEPAVSRLTAKARAVGIHLVLATQRPSVDVITGIIKANIPSRIAFMVASYTDSRVILDAAGAEMLLGKGDMLFKSSWSPNLVRIQSAFLSDEEVERIVCEVKKMGEPEYIDDEIFIEEEDDDYESGYSGSGGEGGGSTFDKALDIVAATGKASASYLQRRLCIGYNKAARLIEEMEAKGIIGPANGSKPREILHLPDRFKE